MTTMTVVVAVVEKLQQLGTAQDRIVQSISTANQRDSTWTQQSLGALG